MRQYQLIKKQHKTHTYHAIIIIVILACIISIGFFCGIFDRTPTIKVDENAIILFTNERPKESNKNILLCVPAAYSSTDDNIIGHYSVGGKRKGITDYRYTTIYLDRSTHFQQASLVRNHKPKSFSDSKLRYRRALCKSGNQYSIVHSSTPVSLSSFAKSLIAFESAWNLDMGTYAYGWYRDNGSLHHLGLSSVWNKSKQTNWLIVTK